MELELKRYRGMMWNDDQYDGYKLIYYLQSGWIIESVRNEYRDGNDGIIEVIIFNLKKD